MHVVSGKRNKKVIFITSNNSFQQQVKETYQSTENKLPFLSKKTPKKVFLNKKIISNIRQKGIKLCR